MLEMKSPDHDSPRRNCFHDVHTLSSTVLFVGVMSMMLRPSVSDAGQPYTDSAVLLQ